MVELVNRLLGGLKVPFRALLMVCEGVNRCRWQLFDVGELQVLRWLRAGGGDSRHAA